MDVEKSFHMTGGDGDTSYALNSSVQKKIADMVKHITLETVQQLYLRTTPERLAIADLGCSSGPNTFSIIRDLYQAVVAAAASSKLNQPSPPELVVYLNDLPTNDFNSIFKALPDFYGEIRREKGNSNVVEDGHSPSIYIAAFPGSFYGRVFPLNSLHFIYSSYSLHWLSKVPPMIFNEHGKSINKGSIHICPNSPPQVIQAYERQFQEDFSLFLRLRSQELVVGGQMVLVFLGRQGPNHIDRGHSFFWKLLTKSFTILISQGKVLEEKLDSYDAHFYAPSKDEIEQEVRKEGSFKLERLEMLEVDDLGSGKAIAMGLRAIQESMISHHFGQEILDSLFDIYARLIDEELSKEKISHINFLLVLTKL
ncbi:hypothetical protein Ancab_003250 [Ancistrocladus abbreviatus]